MTMRAIAILILVLLCSLPAFAQSPLAERLEDLRLETSVRLALAENAEMRVFDVSVEVAEGVVLLSGLVPTLGTRDRVVAFVSALQNVPVVRSTLRLEGQPDQPLADPISHVQRADENTEALSGRVDSTRMQLDDVDQADPQYHTVQRGDTLFGIARRYETSVSEISELNNLNSTMVRVGQRLRVK